MNDQNGCGSFQAAALYDLHRRGATGYSGVTLVADLDQAAAGICRCEADGTVTQIREFHGQPAAPFFPALARELAPDFPDPAGLERALYHAAPTWSRALRSHIRSPQAGIDLPPVMDGAPAIPVSHLADFFAEQWEAPIRQVLEAAGAYLRGQNIQTPRILPIGSLARVFLAEYLIRESFFPGPAAMLPVLPGLAACAPNEYPDQFVQEGQAIWAELNARAHSLETTVMLQVQRRGPDGLVSELLTLAEQDTPYETLRQVRYSDPVFVDIREPLVIFAGSKMHRVTLPYGIFGKGTLAARTEIGLGIEDDSPALMLRLPGGTSAAVKLDLT